MQKKRKSEELPKEAKKPKEIPSQVLISSFFGPPKNRAIISTSTNEQKSTKSFFTPVISPSKPSKKEEEKPLENKKHFLFQLNEDQKKAVDAGYKQRIIFAGPGTGKTEVVANIYLKCISEYKFERENVLLITFTNIGKMQMNNRISLLLSKKENYANTFHGYCFNIISKNKRHVELIRGLQGNLKILDEDKQEEVVRKLMLEGSEKKVTQSDVEEMIAVIQKAQLKHQSPNEYVDLQRHVLEGYASHKKKEKLLDFGDLLMETQKLFQTRPDILKQESKNKKLIICDEFQDTNGVQFDIINSLGAPIIAIGDDDQAIYSFQGASHEHFKKLLMQNSLQQSLTTNYRSSPNIIRLLNAFISKAEGWSAERCKKPELKPANLKKENKPVLLLECGTNIIEVEYITSQVLLKEKRDDIAILYRSNFIEREFNQSFTNHGIPFQVLGRTNFLQNKNGNTYLCILRLMDNSFDADDVEEAFIELYNCRRGILRDYVLKTKESWKSELRKRTKGESVVKFYQENSRQINQFLDYIEGAISKTVQEKMRSAEELCLTAKMNEISLKKLSAFVSKFYQREKKFPQRNGFVTLSTVHKAKGMEWPVVFLCRLNEKVFPALKSSTALLQKEEWRLCYVGLSRAKEELTVSFVNSIRYEEGTVPSQKSIFCKQIEPFADSLCILS